jgi:integrase
MPPKKSRKSKLGWERGVRKRKDGLWDVRLTWHLGGKRHDTERVIDAPSFELALLKRRALLSEMRAPPGLAVTLGEVMESFLFDIKRAGTRKAWSTHGKRIVASFGDRRLSSIETIEVQRFLHDLPSSDATAQAVRKVFSAVYRHAIRSGTYGGANPVLGTIARETRKTSAQELHDAENPKRRAFREDEAIRFLDALSEDMRPLLALQLFCGCRFGEASALEWRDVDLDAGTVRIGRSQNRGEVSLPKGGIARLTGLGPLAVGMLKAHRERMAELRWPGWKQVVFPRPPWGDERRHHYWDYGTIRRGVIAAQKAIGSDVVNRTHVMRHTHITLAEVDSQRAVDQAMEGALRKAHMEATGHSSERQRMQYVDKAALPPSTTAAAVEAAISLARTKPDK